MARVNFKNFTPTQKPIKTPKRHKKRLNKQEKRNKKKKYRGQGR